MRVEQRAFLLSLGKPFVTQAYSSFFRSLSQNVNEQVKGYII